MSSIRVSGNTSGHYDLTVPDVAGSNTIALDKIVVTDSSGNVGIGTSSPSHKLSVITDVDSFVMKVENDGNSAGTVGNAYADASDGLWVDTRWNTATNTPFKVTSNSGTSDMMIIKGDGKVGIGTAQPDLTLHVDGVNGYPATSGSTPVGHISIRAKNESSSHGANIGVADAAPWGTWIQAQDAGNLSTEYPLLLNPNGGNVGIGTNAPLRKLHLADAGDTHIILQSTNAVDNSEIFEIGAGANSANKVDLTFRTRLNSGSGGDERMRITNDGYVTTPNQPAFQALAQGASSSNSGSYLDFTHTILNQGNHFSTTNNRFTAPVAGVYHFHFHTFIDTSNAGTGQISFYKNGSYSFNGYEIRNYHTHRSTGYGPTMVLTATVRLNKFDYIQIYNAGINLHASASNYFGGHLIG